MIKAVLQSIPTYSMNVFALPTTLCKDINSLLGQFWWKQDTTKRPILLDQLEKIMPFKAEGWCWLSGYGKI